MLNGTPSNPHGPQLESQYTIIIEAYQSLAKPDMLFFGATEIIHAACSI